MNTNPDEMAPVDVVTLKPMSQKEAVAKFVDEALGITDVADITVEDGKGLKD